MKGLSGNVVQALDLTEQFQRSATRLASESCPEFNGLSANERTELIAKAKFQMAMKQIKNMFAPESTALLKEMVDLKDSQIDLNTSLTDLFNQVVKNAYPLNNVLSEQIGLKGFTETETEIARCIDFTGLLSKNSTVLSRF